jgi:hypothetical protein
MADGAGFVSALCIFRQSMNWLRPGSNCHKNENSNRGDCCFHEITPTHLAFLRLVHNLIAPFQ